MSTRRMAPVLMLGAIILIGSATAPFAFAEDVETPFAASAVTTTEAEAMRFRQSFGFQADAAFVRATLLDRATYSSEAFGVPLSKAEVAEMFRRARIQSAMDDAIEHARTLPGFAGAYLDQQHGGRPVFMFTSASPLLQTELSALVPDGADAQVVGASRTEEELAALKSHIEADVESWSKKGVQVVRVAIRTSLNTVRIGVTGLTADVEASLKEAYGADVVVFETTIAQSDVCDSTNNCRPMKGGISINHTGGVAGECTSGFVVERTDNAALAILTAGHCIQVHGGFDQAWQHNSQGFGRALYETWEPGGTGDADVGLITIQSPDVALMTNKNQMRRTNGSVANVTSYQLNPLEGAQACRVGHKSGHDCGQITDSDVGHWSEVTGWSSMWVTQTAEVNFDSLGGDSGGPVFYYPGGGTCCTPVRALGTHVHSALDPADNMGWFSPIYVGRSDYDLIPSPVNYTYDICLAASC